MMEYLYFELTRRCNQFCVQCFNNSRDALSGELSTEQVLSVLRNFKDQGGRTLQITGGDPFLRNDIKAILKAVSALRFDHVVLSTNGMLFKEDMANLCAGVVDEFDISLDGFPDMHNLMRGVRSFDLAVSAIKLAKDRGLKVYVCSCLTEETYDRAEEFIEFLIGLGVDHVKLAQIGDVGRRATPSELTRTLPVARVQFDRVAQLAMRFTGRIAVQQSHTTNVRRPDLQRDGLVCDPCGRLYPLIGYLPLHWQVGSAYPNWTIDIERLTDYERVVEDALAKGIEHIVRDGAVNWWTVFHDELVRRAPTLEFAR